MSFLFVNPGYAGLQNCANAATDVYDKKYNPINGTAFTGAYFTVPVPYLKTCYISFDLYLSDTTGGYSSCLCSILDLQNSHQLGGQSVLIYRRDRDIANPFFACNDNLDSDRFVLQGPKLVHVFVIAIQADSYIRCKVYVDGYLLGVVYTGGYGGTSVIEAVAFHLNPLFVSDKTINFYLSNLIISEAPISIHERPYILDGSDIKTALTKDSNNRYNMDAVDETIEGGFDTSVVPAGAKITSLSIGGYPAYSVGADINAIKEDLTSGDGKVHEGGIEYVSPRENGGILTPYITNPITGEKWTPDDLKSYKWKITSKKKDD